MINRNNVVVGLLALLAAVSAVGFALMIGQLGDGCMNGTGLGSCPALADVRGVRYAVSGPVDLVSIEAHVAPYDTIARSNTPTAFSATTALAIDGVDPNVLLLVSAAQSPENLRGAYRELWSLQDDPFPLAYCAFMDVSRRLTQEECGS